MRRHDRLLTHDWIWSALDLLAERRGLTPSGLAKLAGLDPTAFNRSKRFTPEGRPRWPSTESIAKVLDATATSLDEFAAIRIDKPIGPTVDDMTEGEISSIPIIGTVRDAVISDWEPVSTRMAVNGAATPTTTGRRFAVAVGDSSLEPAYSAGNVLIVSDAEEPRAGDRVLVKPAGMPVLPRLLLAASRSAIELTTFADPTGRMSVLRNDFEWMAKIVLVRQ